MMPMESVMISIQPRWCELIVSKEKTVEVRKSKPGCNVPFKCYIYECKDKRLKGIYKIPYQHSFGYGYSFAKEPTGSGKVIGEFICNGIYDFRADDDYAYGIYDIDDDLVLRTCLENGKLWDYGRGKPLYGWNISDLKIYDKPKELSEFFHYCGDEPNCKGCGYYYHEGYEGGTYEECGSPLECFKELGRPPQSWMYVEVADCQSDLS